MDILFLRFIYVSQFRLLALSNIFDGLLKIRAKKQRTCSNYFNIAAIIIELVIKSAPGIEQPALGEIEIKYRYFILHRLDAYQPEISQNMHQNHPDAIYHNTHNALRNTLHNCLGFRKIARHLR